MRILIYGAGAVGLGLASSLIKAGSRTDILGRANTIEALRKNGLIRTGIFGQFKAQPNQFNAYTSLDEIKNTKYDYILVCTKSPDTSTAAQDIANHKNITTAQTKIVLFQNGWSNAENFCSFFEKEKIYNARVITGFRRPKDNEVEITVHADAIHIGSLSTQQLAPVEKLCELITKGGIPCKSTQQIEKDLWAKMLYNCALNPLGAILDVPYGALAQTTFTRAIMDSIIKEIFEVLNASGYKTHWEKPEDFIKVFYDKLIPATAQHKSSTLQDIHAGKKTEIDALNGAVIRLAEQRGIDVPYNRIVYNLIRFIEEQNLTSNS